MDAAYLLSQTAKGTAFYVNISQLFESVDIAAR